MTTSGRTPRLLEAEERAGAADAGLHLVEDEQRAELVGERARRLEELGRRRVHAALALDRLDQDRARVRPGGGDERLDVVQRREGDAGDERPERLALRRLAGHRQRAHRAPVERALERDEPRPAGRLARVLERRLDRLGAGVAEERLRAAEAVGQPPGERCHRLRPVEVRRVPEPVELLVRGRERRRMAVAERDDGDAGDEVEVALARVGDEPGALAGRRR